MLSVDNQQTYTPRCFLTTMYSAVVALLPVFASYASGVSGFSMADIILIICVMYVVICKNHQKKNHFIVQPLLIWVALYLMILFSCLSMQIQSNPEYYSIIIRTIRYFFYLATIVICSKRVLDLERCRKWIKRICLIATCYIFVQAILYLTGGVILRGYLPFLKLYVEGYATTDYASLYTSMYRPTSFFLEPAHYARYMAIGIALFLFDDKILEFQDVMAAIVLSAGILISTSAQGYLLLMILWGICLFTRSKSIESNKLRVAFYFTCIVLPLLLIAISQIPFVQSTLSRALNIDTSNLSNENTAFGARLGGFSYYLELEPIYQIIGRGFGVVPKSGWLSSAAYWLYGSGCIVFILYFAYAVMVLAKSHGSARIIGLIFLILFFTDDSFYSYMCVLFISLSCLQPKGGDIA